MWQHTIKPFLPLIVVGVTASLVGGILGFGGSIFLGQRATDGLRQVAWLPEPIKQALPVPPAPSIIERIMPGQVIVPPNSSVNPSSAPIILDEEALTKRVVESVSPSVVSISISREVVIRQTQSLNDFFQIQIPGFEFVPQQQEPQPDVKTLPKTERKVIGGGTGFLISDQGLILTNRHVVAEAQDFYTVILNDGRKFDAKVLARDTVNDLALIKIEGKNLPPPIRLGDSTKISIGQTVIAIGNTLSQYQNTVTKGVISGIGRRIQAGDNLGETETIENAIQTDAAINPGNSGGPLLNLQGEVIGINTAINSQGQLIGFAIPIGVAKQMITSYQKYGRIVRPMLGIRYTIVTPDFAKKNNLSYDYGVLIQRGRGTNDIAVIPNSPAEKAGLKEGDIILEMDGQKITEEFSVTQYIAKHNVGDVLSLKIASEGGVVKTVKVTLTERGEQ